MWKFSKAELPDGMIMFIVYKNNTNPQEAKFFTQDIESAKELVSHLNWSFLAKDIFDMCKKDAE